MIIEILLIILICLLITVGFLFIILYLFKSRTMQRRVEIFFSGGADIETGRISLDTKFFKGIPEDLHETNVLVINKKQNKGILLSITNLKKGISEKIYVADVLRIGRCNADYIISDDRTVSKTHCCLYVREGRLYVRDLDSRNHTYKNGKAVFKGTVCNSGDEIKVGDTVLKIQY